MKPGEVYGNAGGSLNDYASWGKGDQSRADIGQKGEEKTARVLNGLATQPGGPTILHDLKIPLQGIKANIDHILVTGNTVVIIDTKVWKPGTYWTFGGTSRRGMEKVPHVQKKTMEMASDAINGFLEKKGFSANVVTPLLVVWPSSSSGKTSLRFLKVPGATVLTPEQFESRRGIGAYSGKTLRSPSGKHTADPSLVAALSTLLM